MYNYKYYTDFNKYKTNTCINIYLLRRMYTVLHNAHSSYYSHNETLISNYIWTIVVNVYVCTLYLVRDIIFIYFKFLFISQYYNFKLFSRFYSFILAAV